MISIKNYRTLTPALNLAQPFSCEIPTGALVSVVGPNGSGKTTFLRWLLSHACPTTNLHERAKKISWMSAHVHADDEFFVTDHVLLGRYPWRQASATQDKLDLQKVDEICRKLGIAHLAHRKMGELSSGEKRLADLARACVGEQSICIFDEPTQHLDLKYESFIFELLKSWAQEGRTIATSVHNISYALRYSTHILCLDSTQKKIHFGAPHEILTPELIQQIFGVSVVNLNQIVGRSLPRPP
jgi:iron complex transport system ATP-binding protein